MDHIRHVIDGELVDSADGATFETVNPYTQQAWATVARGSTEDANRAAASARKAFDEGPWPKMSPDERAKYIHKLADLIDAHNDELATMETTDMGKPITAAKTRDMPRSSHNFRFFADYARFVEDESIPASSGHHMYTRYEPVGVASAISPWNFPLMLATWKVAPALAFGNTVCLKPAEQTPGTCGKLGELAIEAGFPPGVLNVVQGFGPGEAGEALTVHPGVDLVTFTGESGTGRRIMANVAPGLKRVSFELGGKGANLVFADSDMDKAVHWSIAAVFTNTGQVCLAGSRIFVERSVYDEFIDRFVEAAEAMKIGDPMDAATEIGPLASEEHWEKVCTYVDMAEEQGGKILTGGRGDGWYVKPTVVVDSPKTSRLCNEEIFGPVVTVSTFDDEAEAVRLANDSPYGLNAMVMTENVRRAHRVAGQLRAGTIWVNCFFIRDLRLPFGGYKDSGIGREGGKHSREFFTEGKAVVMEL